MTLNPRPWRLAVAGCGAAAFGLHLPLLTNSAPFEVIAAADRDPDRARAAAQRFAIPRGATTTQALLEGADMLVILTGVHEDLAYAALIEHFHQITGIPVVLNTSYNDREPIVETPAHALATLQACDLDAACIGNYLVERV